MAGDELYTKVLLTAGAAEADLAGDLLGLQVDEREAGPASARLTLADPDLLLAGAVQEGSGLVVELGTAAAHATVFRGEVYRVESSLRSEAVPQLAVVAYDAAMRAGLRTRSRGWPPGPLADVVTSIAREHRIARQHVTVGADVRLPASGERQQDETDLAFLLRLGAQFGVVVAVAVDDDGEELRCEPQTDLVAAEPSLPLTYRGPGEGGGSAASPTGGDVDQRVVLTSFTARADVADAVLPVVLAGMDAAAAGPVTAAQPSVGGLSTSDTDRPPGPDVPLLAAAARNAARADRLSAVLAGAGTVRASQRDALGTDVAVAVPGLHTAQDLTGLVRCRPPGGARGQTAWATCQGSPRLRPRIRVHVAGVGPRFGGAWYVTGVRHLRDDRTYRTELTCWR